MSNQMFFDVITNPTITLSRNSAQVVVGIPIRIIEVPNLSADERADLIEILNYENEFEIQILSLIHNERVVTADEILRELRQIYKSDWALRGKAIMAIKRHGSKKFAPGVRGMVKHASDLIITSFGLTMGLTEKSKSGNWILTRVGRVFREIWTGQNPYTVIE